MNEIYLSIVIPTKNRYKYLLPLIVKLLEFKSNSFEIVVNDNSFNNKEIIKFVEDHKLENRFKYFHNPKELNIIENCDEAILNSNGKYICLLGDDDGIIEEIIPFAKWMYENKIDSASFNNIIYHWPDLLSKYSINSFSGYLLYYKYTKKISYINQYNELIKILQYSAQSIFKGVKLYHGLVSKNALNILYNKTGTYFPGPVPDMSSSIALTFFVKKHIYYDYPMIISGASGGSTAGLGSQKLHQKKIEEVSYLPSSTSKLWTSWIPKYWSGATIWAEGAIKALEKTGNSSLIKYFNIERLYVTCFINDNTFRKYNIAFFIKQYGEGVNKIKLYKLIYYFFWIVRKKIRSLINSILIKFHISQSVSLVYCKTIANAIDFLNIELKK